MASEKNLPGHPSAALWGLKRNVTGFGSLSVVVLMLLVVPKGKAADFGKFPVVFFAVEDVHFV